MTDPLQVTTAQLSEHLRRARDQVQRLLDATSEWRDEWIMVRKRLMQERAELDVLIEWATTLQHPHDLVFGDQVEALPEVVQDAPEGRRADRR